MSQNGWHKVDPADVPDDGRYAASWWTVGPSRCPGAAPGWAPGRRRQTGKEQLAEDYPVWYTPTDPA